MSLGINVTEANKLVGRIQRALDLHDYNTANAIRDELVYYFAHEMSKYGEHNKLANLVLKVNDMAPRK